MSLLSSFYRSLLPASARASLCTDARSLLRKVAMSSLGPIEGSLFVALYWGLTVLVVSEMLLVAGPVAAALSTAWCTFVFLWGCRGTGL